MTRHRKIPDPCRESKWCYAQGCRNEVCRKEHKKYENLRKYTLAKGRIPTYMDATEAREHLLFLKENGIGCNQISDATGITPTALIKIREGRTSRIRVTNSNKILGVGLHMFKTRYQKRIKYMESVWREKKNESVSVEVQAV